jgi:2-oxo-3-hexenedioate decarboxylase
MLDMQTVARLAEHLEKAEMNAFDVDKITDEHPGMDIADAYAIQNEIRRRKTARGVKVVGFKAGLTSRAKMRQMQVDTPSYGFLADYFAVPDGGEVDVSTLIHPKVEPEIAFVTKKPLSGPGCHVAQVLAATDFVMPAIEIIDSRYRNFRFDVASVIADNSSSSRFVIGGRMRAAEDLDLRSIGMVLEKNGEPVAFGAGAAVLGNPAAAIAMVTNLLGARGEEIPAGSIVLSGSITEAIAVGRGDSVAVRAQDLGSVSCRFR